MNLQSIDLNLLVAFESLMDERNVTRAARRIGLSQPAMSNALTRLRRTFGDPLLVRTPGGMMPTSAAQALIGPVRASLAQLRAALEQKPAFAPAASRRVFHLFSNDYAEIMLLAPVIKALRENAEAISLRIHRSASVFQPPTPNSLADSFSLAIGFFPDALSLDASLHSELLWEEKNVCIASASHPSIKGKIRLRQYAAASHVAVFYKSEGPGVIDTLLAQKGLSRQVAVQVPHFASVPFMVACSDLIATLPERFALEFSKRLKLQVLPAPIVIPPFRLTMLWHERAHHDPAHEWVRGLIARTAAKLNG
ncbi:MAG TPA: LysR family transcriptional regulator [Blastocatellia bacterium]|nr:LysR family transcriptional regulator [Blastocatellia bacterium]